MKTPSIFLSIILFLAFQASMAQSPIKFRHQADPTYSVHNYKHPDKALLARQLNLNPVNVVEYTAGTAERGVSPRNYKNQIQTQRTLEPSKPVSTDARQPTGIQSPANYKRQF
jgi:hypothetical protein